MHRSPRTSYWFRRDRKRRPHVISWQDPRSGRRRFRSFERKQTAKEWARHLEQELANPRKTSATWDEAISEYATRIRAYSAKHKYDIVRALNSFYNFAQPEYLDDAHPERLDAYMHALLSGKAYWIEPKTMTRRQRKPSASEARKDWAALHAFFTLMVKRDKLATNPLVTIPKPALPATTPRVPAVREWVALLEALSDGRLKLLMDRQAWYIYILLAATTGLDREDLLRLRIGDFRIGDEEVGHIGLLTWDRTKKRALAKYMATGFHGLAPGVNNMVADRIGSLLATEDNDDHLFPWGTFQRKQWDQIRRAAGFAYPFKSLRKATATQAAEAAALQAAADELTHSHTAVTQRHYTDRERLALARAAALKLPALPPLPSFRSLTLRRAIAPRSRQGSGSRDS